MNASLCAILNTMKSLFPWSNPILNACLYAFRVRRFRQDVKNILYKQHMERKFGSKYPSNLNVFTQLDTKPLSCWVPALTTCGLQFVLAL